MRVSVVIPTANDRPRQLVRALRSVVAQRLGPPVSDVAIIVANNSGRPLTEDIGHCAGSGSVRIVDASHARGVSHARNAGARSARFDAVAFLDDDDWWTETYLQEMCQAMCESGADLVWCGQQNWNDGGQITTGKQAPATLTLEQVFLDNPGVTGSNMLVSRDAFERLGGFDERLTASNDKDFLLRFLKGGFRHQAVPRRLTIVDVSSREHLGRLSRQKIESARLFYRLHAADVTREVRQQFRFRLRLWEAMLHRSWVGLGWLWLRNPRRRKTIRYWSRKMWHGGPIDV